MEFVAENRIILPKSYTDGLSGGLKVYIIIENIYNKYKGKPGEKICKIEMFYISRCKQVIPMVIEVKI